jgi:hypothetical protein
MMMMMMRRRMRRRMMMMMMRMWAGPVGVPVLMTRNPLPPLPLLQDENRPKNRWSRKVAPGDPHGILPEAPALKSPKFRPQPNSFDDLEVTDLSDSSGGGIEMSTQQRRRGRR